MANTAGAIQRITREIQGIQRNEDLSIAVAFQDENVRTVRGLIVGPPETPYAFGFFEFHLDFPKDYPLTSPRVACITTNNGRTRFNPNIYAEGKVCLSILGTWRGEEGEQWSSAQGLESVLLSIQSLMSPNPYENEPGHEKAKKEQPRPAAYIQKIRHETMRISVLQRLERLLNVVVDKPSAPTKRGCKRAHSSDSDQSYTGSPQPGTHGHSSPANSATPSSAYEYDAEATYQLLEPTPWDPFADLMKRRFLWYYDNYLRSVEEASKEQKDGTAFPRMEFEYPPNTMDGTYQYEALRKRFGNVLSALEREKLDWVKQGAQQVVEGTQLATQLAFQFKQLAHRWHEQRKSGSRLELSLPQKENPFHWQLTFFGKPEHNLDEGIFTINMHIPLNFPEAQPRVQFETPIFHHRVSFTTGALCYFPEKEDNINSHLEAIVVAIEDENPTYDPRAMVNSEATELYWGGADKRKIYNRRLRRSAQESCGA